MKVVQHSRFITTIEGFWSEEKCDALIARSEAIGYEPALIQTERGPKRVAKVRNNQRVLFTDQDLAIEIWNTMYKHVQPVLGNSDAVGLNEMFRFYKYEPGQEFKKHRDESFIRNEGESSYFTLMVYLNDDFEGGETEFNKIMIVPKKGTCLIFIHDLEHEGRRLISGKKYVLRTDVMYKLRKKQ